MQENMWARLRDSCPGTRVIHATYPTYFPALPYCIWNTLFEAGSHYHTTPLAWEHNIFRRLISHLQRYPPHKKQSSLGSFEEDPWHKKRALQSYSSVSEHFFLEVFLWSWQLTQPSPHNVQHFCTELGKRMVSRLRESRLLAPSGRESVLMHPRTNL